ncbi:dual specificity protein phosphatase family protein [Pyrococcus sp. ST04]|uniref:protein-tyrosine phosphatase family protein n=1 Tax=Pyrococcus sp. ST04 TaxID=1183377 RepID=UPI0002605E8D|nr:dual specificity protein phosphatase family protein [Pyrococcus sp. ST04]AFK23214.1 putative Protein tyrosine/serine/threonine phosphatase [Pyrococcus sp. ST04]
MDVRFIDESVAFSRMPYEDELEELVKEFQAFVVLVEEFELVYNLDDLRARADVLHVPIPDFTAPSLKELTTIVEWIERKVNEGKKVLIHCYGGSGRSGTIAVAWLMYKHRLPLKEALRKVRILKPSAVETEEQMNILMEFEKIIRDDDSGAP